MPIEPTIAQDMTGLDRFSDCHPSVSSAPFAECDPHLHPTAKAAADAVANAFQALHSANCLIEDSLSELQQWEPGNFNHTTGAYAQYEEKKAAWRKATEDKLKAAGDRADKCASTLITAQAALTNAIEAKFRAPTSPAAIAVASEIRQHVRGLQGADRLKFVNDACSRGDTVTLAAVFSRETPFFLSGYDAAKHSEMRTFCEQRIAPNETLQIEAIRKALSNLSAQHDQFNRRWGEAAKYATARPVPKPKPFRASPASQFRS